MIAYLKGEIISIEDRKITLYNSATGVGWEVNAPINDSTSISEHDGIELFIKTIVREDDISLYGFFTKQQKSIFEQIISVSGFGPKTAIEILSRTTPETLANGIVAGDVKTVSGIKGLGPKSAEKLIFNLKDKLKKEYAGTTSKVKCEKVDEVIQGLMFLGYTKNEATKITNNTYDETLDVSQNIAKALKQKT